MRKLTRFEMKLSHVTDHHEHLISKAPHPSPMKANDICKAIRADGLTYLGEKALADLYAQAARIERENVKGVMIEAGCGLGGSAITIAHAKAVQRPLYIYDVFGMIPPPSEKDGPDVHARYNTIRSGKSTGIRGRPYYGYEEDLLGKVVAHFARHGRRVEENNIHLVKGLFEDTIPRHEQVAMAHIDGDWYASVRVCLERIAPALALGGVMVIDDYQDWSGCRRAVDEFFRNKQGEYQLSQRTRLYVTRLQ